MSTYQNPSPLQVAILLESLWLHDIQNIPFLPCWMKTEEVVTADIMTLSIIFNKLESGVSLSGSFIRIVFNVQYKRKLSPTGMDTTFVVSSCIFFQIATAKKGETAAIF